MKLNKKYIYPKTIREAINGKRHYNINDGVVDDKIKIEKLKNLLKDVEKARLQ